MSNKKQKEKGKERGRKRGGGGRLQLGTGKMASAGQGALSEGKYHKKGGYI